MIHAHVIITAVVLLVGAFAALIICMCVDIVPIIKSRGSTLASRDSATQEQARKLKKSLRQTKHQLGGSTSAYGRSEKLSTRHVRESASKNLYESNNHLSLNRAAEAQVSPTATKFPTSTATTTTVVVSTATQGGANATSHCFATPEGDHSTQQTSSAASSLSQNSKGLSVAVEVDSARTPSPSKQPKCSSSYVMVSVHSAGGKTVAAKLHSGESSPARSRAALSRRSTDDNLDRPEVHSSPSFNRSRQSLGSGKFSSQRSIESHGESVPSVDYEPHRSNRGHHSRTHTPNEDRPGSYLEQRRPNSANSDFGEDSGDKESHSSRHRDYHDAPWDSAYREPLVFRDQQLPCKWCYADHAQCTRHHHGPRSLSTTPAPVLNAHSHSASNSPSHFEENVPCSCGYHRPKVDGRSHSSSPHMRQKYTARYERQASPSRSLAGGSLHGSGSYHRSSPCHSSSSSVSPSSLSSSSHSSKRKRRTKLEDIQEDAGWSDDEEGHAVKREEAALLDNGSNGASRRDTPSTLHSSVPEGASSDNEHTNYAMDAAFQTSLSQYLGMKRGSRDLAIVNDTKTAIEGIVTYSGT